MKALQTVQQSRYLMELVKTQRDMMLCLRTCDADTAMMDAYTQWLETRAELAGERAMAVLTRLPPGKVTAVLIRYYVLGGTIADIASAMDCTVRSVRRYKAMGLKMLERMDTV